MLAPWSGMSQFRDCETTGLAGGVHRGSAGFCNLDDMSRCGGQEPTTRPRMDGKPIFSANQSVDGGRSPVKNGLYSRIQVAALCGGEGPWLFVEGGAGDGEPALTPVPEA